MATGYLTLFDVSGNGLGMASAATSITTENRSLTVGSGTLTAATGTFTNMGGTLTTVSQPNVTTLAGVTTLNNLTIGSGSISGLTTLNKALGIGIAGASTRCVAVGGDVRQAGVANYGIHCNPTLGQTSGSGTVTGIYASLTLSSNVATIDSAYGVYIDDPGSVSGTVTETYGLYVKRPTVGTSKYTAYFQRGIFIGTVASTQTAIYTSVDSRTASGTDSYGMMLVNSLGVTSGSTTSGTGLYLNPSFSSNAGTITTARGIHISAGTTGGTVTTGYGLYVENPAFGTTKTCAYFEGDVYAGTTTAPTLSSRLVLSSSTQNSARLTLSGQEFFAPGTSSTDGVGLLIGVNRTNNRQLWIVDTANASAASTTNYTVRIAAGNVAAIDAISTDGATTQTLSISRASITFPTTGGSAATLNYYEENSSLSLTFTGIWASDQTVTGKLVRIGTVVTLSIPDAYATANTSAAISLTGGTVLPSRYRPTADRTYPAILFDNGSNVAGSVVVRNTGQVNFYKTIAYGAFTGSGTSGILSLVLQWLIL